MTEEPTVLDYVKALLTPWRGAPPAIPPPAPQIDKLRNSEAEPQTDKIRDGEPEPQTDRMRDNEPEPQTDRLRDNEPEPQTDRLRDNEAEPQTNRLSDNEVGPQTNSLRYSEAHPRSNVGATWRSLLALGFALAAQFSLEPRPNRGWLTGVILYALAAGLLVIANLRGEWLAAPLPASIKRRDPLTIRRVAFLAAVILAAASFLLFSDNRFTAGNVMVWLVSITAFIYAFWLPAPDRVPLVQRLRQGWRSFNWRGLFSGWMALVIIATALVIFFRVYRLNDVPPEMTSDHAEKLLDVWDVLHGQTSIFFPRNTGREALQFYLTAAIIRLFGTGYTFTSLKIGTLLAGLLTLPFIYLLGKEVGNRRVGLIAMIFTGIAFWPNAITRDALRFTLYPLFVAPSLYFLLRGLRTSNRNDFILAGLALGIGLHGYSPIRILPFVLIVAAGLFLIHRQSKGVRTQTVIFFILLGSMALIVFLPLLRYAIANPDIFNYRIITRIGPAEQPLPDVAWRVFLGNLWRGLAAFSWDNGEIWVHVVPHRPALDIISAALLNLGVIVLLVRYIRQRHWLDLFLVLSIPLLMLPSILSLSFPNENPAMNRAAGALVPVFLIVGIALEGLLTSIQSIPRGAWGTRLAFGLGTILIIGASIQNYDLLFNQFRKNFALSSWNSSEMGQVIRKFADAGGNLDHAWVVPYPHWVDTRLVGFNAGNPTKDYARWPDQLPETQIITDAKLFILNISDSDALQKLQALYPQGRLEEYQSKTETKNFLIYYVPPEG